MISSGVVQGMRLPAAWEMDPLEVRYRKFDLPLLQFLKVCPAIYMYGSP